LSEEILWVWRELTEVYRTLIAGGTLVAVGKLQDWSALLHTF
jgi:hypothetical protein